MFNFDVFYTGARRCRYCGAEQGMKNDEYHRTVHFPDRELPCPVEILESMRVTFYYQEGLYTPDEEERTLNLDSTSAATLEEAYVRLKGELLSFRNPPSGYDPRLTCVAFVTFVSNYRDREPATLRAFQKRLAADYKQAREALQAERERAELQARAETLRDHLGRLERDRADYTPEGFEKHRVRLLQQHADAATVLGLGAPNDSTLF